LKKFVLGLIVGLLIRRLAGIYTSRWAYDAGSHGVRPLPMEEKIRKAWPYGRGWRIDPVQQSPVPQTKPTLTRCAYLLENCAFCHGFAGEKPALAPRHVPLTATSCLSGDDMVTDDPPARLLKVENGIRLTECRDSKNMLHAHADVAVSLMLQACGQTGRTRRSGVGQAGKRFRWRTQPDACGNAGQKSQ